MSEKEKVQKQFGKNASNYVTSKSHAKGTDLRELVDVVKSHGVLGDVLDIATGGGHVANALASLNLQVTAYDLTKEMLQKAEEFILTNGHKNVRFVKGDAEKLTFSEQSFEIITCRIAAHHFPNPHRFIQEVFRVLKPGGLFILVDNVAPEKTEFDEFYNTVEKKRDYSHIRAYKKSEWLTMVEEAGLRVDRMKTFEKKFDFNTWCTMMDLPQKETNELNTYMKASSETIKHHFRIKLNQSGLIESFFGQSMLLAAVKN